MKISANNINEDLKNEYFEGNESPPSEQEPL